MLTMRPNWPTFSGVCSLSGPGGLDEEASAGNLLVHFLSFRSLSHDFEEAIRCGDWRS